MKKYLVEVSRDVREYQTVLVEAYDERHARYKATLKANGVPDAAWSRGETVACDTWDCSELKEED